MAHLVPSVEFLVPFEKYWQRLYNPRPRRQISQDDNILKPSASASSVF